MLTLGVSIENLLLVTQQLRSVIQTLYEASVAIHDYAGQSSMEHIASQMYVGGGWG